MRETLLSEELEAEAETVVELIADLINWTDKKAMKVIEGRCLEHFNHVLDEYEHMVESDAPNDVPEATTKFTPKPSCATCRFNGGRYAFPGTETVKCVRYPPVAINPENTEWPMVYLTDWCGEFEERVTK